MIIGDNILLEKKNIGFHQGSKPSLFTQSSQQLILLLGYLGSGKTTTLKDIAHYLKQSGKKIALVVNDIGKFNIDAERFDEEDVEALTQGCICCSDLLGLLEVLQQKKNNGVDTIIIEPTGIASGEQIVEEVKKLGFSIDVISLFNIQTFHKKKDDYTIQVHQALADVIGLTHLQLGENTKEIEEKIRDMRPGINIIQIPDPNREQILKEAYVYQLMDALNSKPGISFPIDSLKLDVKNQINPKPRSIQLSEYCSLQDLQELVDYLGDSVERLKGLVYVSGQAIHFDYVQGSLLRTTSTASDMTLSPYMNLITTYKLTEEQDLFLQKWMTKTQNPILEIEGDKKSIKILTIEESDQTVQKLLNQYSDYMVHHIKKEQLEKLYQISMTNKLAQEITDLYKYLQKLGDDMKFDNPYIWMSYKYYAYKNSNSKKVETISHLRKHCETKTDICHKRLDFFSEQLKSKYHLDFFDDKAIDGSMDIISFIKKYPYVIEFSGNDEFMQQRSCYEYYKNHSGLVEKWQNY